MHTKQLVLGIVTVLCARVAAAAPAESDLRRRGHLIFSADRLVPLVGYDREKVTSRQAGETVTTTTSQSSFSLLWGAGSPVESGLRPFTSPRIAVDYTLMDGLTVGGSVAWFHTLGGTVETQTVGVPTTQSRDTPSLSVVGLSPRVGYVLSLGDRLAFWPRGGFSYTRGSSTATRITGNGLERSEEVAYDVWALDVEAMLAFVPVPHVAIVGGPSLDLPLAGTRSDAVTLAGTTSTTSGDFSAAHFGVTLGLAVYF